MSQVINVEVVYYKAVIVEDTGCKDTKQYQDDYPVTIPTKDWKKVLVKEFKEILDKYTTIKSIYISI